MTKHKHTWPHVREAASGDPTPHAIHGDVNTPKETWPREDEDAADGIPDDTAGALRMGGGGNSPTAPVASHAIPAANGGVASGTTSRRSGSGRPS